MHPREALYNLVVALGPMPATRRDDNLSADELRIRESVETLKLLVNDYESLEDFLENPDQLELTF